jgi:hypothetical protein
MMTSISGPHRPFQSSTTSFPRPIFVRLNLLFAMAVITILWVRLQKFLILRRCNGRRPNQCRPLRFRYARQLPSEHSFLSRKSHVMCHGTQKPPPSCVGASLCPRNGVPPKRTWRYLKRPPLLLILHNVLQPASLRVGEWQLDLPMKGIPKPLLCFFGFIVNWRGFYHRFAYKRDLNLMSPGKEVYAEALRCIRNAEKSGALELDLNGWKGGKTVLWSEAKSETGYFLAWCERASELIDPLLVELQPL